MISRAQACGQTAGTMPSRAGPGPSAPRIRGQNVETVQVGGAGAGCGGPCEGWPAAAMLLHCLLGRGQASAFDVPPLHRRCGIWRCARPGARRWTRAGPAGPGGCPLEWLVLTRTHLTALRAPAPDSHFSEVIEWLRRTSPAMRALWLVERGTPPKSAGGAPLPSDLRQALDIVGPEGEVCIIFSRATGLADVQQLSLPACQCCVSQGGPPVLLRCIWRCY